MKYQHLSTLLVSLSLLSSACAHYDPKKPNFNKSSAPVPEFEGQGQTAAINSGVITGIITGKAATIPAMGAEANTPAAPAKDPMNPDPLQGPGMITTPVPTVVVTTPTKVPTPPSAPVASQTYKEAIEAVDRAKNRDPNLKNFWVGGGYDVLAGSRTSTCLDPDTLRTSVITAPDTKDSLTVSHDYQELYSNLENEFGASVGGIWQLFTGGVSVKTKIMKETRMTSDDVVILTSLTYTKDQIILENSGADYAEYFQNLSATNKLKFRQYCGDRFTKDVTTGATMTLSFTAKKTGSETWNKSEVDSAVKAGMTGLFSVGVNSGVNNEQKKILEGYTFSTKCYTVGTSTDVCGSFSSVTGFDINRDTATIQQKISEARQKFLAEAKDGRNLAVVRETQLDYKVPSASCTLDGRDACPKQFDYFVDYRDRLSRVKLFGVQKSVADDICSRVNFWTNRCSRISNDLTTATQACVDLGSECRDADYSNYNFIQSARNPGSVEMWDSADFKGAVWTLNFGNILSGTGLVAKKFYTFNDVGLGKANDKVSAMRVRIHPDWTIRFYKDTDPRSPGQTYDKQGPQDIGFIGYIWPDSNDKFSSFELLPPGDI